MSYEAVAIRINISINTFYTLKCDENCFGINNSINKKLRISDTMINAIINNMDISDIPEDKVISYNTCKDNFKFNSKLSKSANKKLNDNSILNTGIYVSRLLELYAKKAYYERERIYYKNCIEMIEDIKARKKLLSLKYRNNCNTMLIYPYDVRTDEWSSYNYLIGIDISNECRLVNLRISYISEYETVQYKSTYPKCTLSKEHIEKKIIACGVQFVSDEIEEIKVRLPEGKGNGKDMYDHMVFMRPVINTMPTPNNPDIYTFKCTTKQAEYYFFKFGAKIEIIEPYELRQKFIEMYKCAYDHYKN